MEPLNEKEMHELFAKVRTIAVVGLSSNPSRPSFGVASYLQRAGFKIIPVNPECDEVLGEKCYRNLADIPEPVDLVDIFRRSEFVPAIVDEALAKGVKAVWMQEGVVNEAAAAIARQAGLSVVMDRCIYKEHRHLR